MGSDCISSWSLLIFLLFSVVMFPYTFNMVTCLLSGCHACPGERGGSVVECRTPEREVRGSRPTAAVLCPWARHFTPRKYWLITQEAMAPFRYDWKIVDWDVKPQHNQPTKAMHVTHMFFYPWFCHYYHGVMHVICWLGRKTPTQTKLS